MDLVVDPIIYQIQAKGGISRIFLEILPRMCDLDEALHVTMLTSGSYKQDLPAHNQIHNRRVFPIERWLRPSRLWWSTTPDLRAITQSAVLGDSTGKIWHSTYFTHPFHWKGRIAVTVADLIYERFQQVFDSPQDEWLRQQQRKCVQAADAVICISHATKDDVITYYGVQEKKIYVTHLSHGKAFRVLETSEMQPISPTGRPFLLYIGMRAVYKNFDFLMSVYSAWKACEEIDLVIVGGSPSENEQNRIDELKISDRVHFLQGVDDQLLCTLYNQAVAFVYPSLYEGFGIPLLEAMACGCPVVASRIPSTVEIAGSCAIYFEPTSKEGLIEALNTAITEGRSSSRTRLGLQQTQQFSWDRTAKQTLAIYHALS